MNTPTCPCCSHTLLRHARSGEVYWFCRYCYEEMPNLLTTDPTWIKSTTFLGSTTVGLPKKGLVSPSALVTQIATFA